MQAMRPANEAAKKKCFFVCPTSDSSATPLKRAGERKAAAFPKRRSGYENSYSIIDNWIYASDLAPSYVHNYLKPQNIDKAHGLVMNLLIQAKLSELFYPSLLGARVPDYLSNPTHLGQSWRNSGRLIQQ